MRPHTIASKKPRYIFPLMYAPMNPPHAPMRNIPSTAVTIIPVLSAITSPSAPRIRGVLIKNALAKRLVILFILGLLCHDSLFLKLI